MRAMVRFLAVILALLAGGTTWAQEPRGWIGADVQDVTKAEADKLGWDGPRGAKIKLIAPGSPADKAGLKEEDIVEAIDGTEVETSAAFETTVAAKPQGAHVRLRVRSGGRERRVAVAVTERPRAQVADQAAVPILMLDPGGHMGQIRGLTFTSDGKRLVSAGDDKVVRVWDWQGGKTVRTIRGQVGPGPEGRVHVLALSPNGRWLAVGGYLGDFTGTKPREDEEAHKVRLYEFASGRLSFLLKGHTSPVNGLAFSMDSKRLISGSFDSTAIIWDVEKRELRHRLRGHKKEIHAVGFTPDGARAVTGSDDATLKLWSVSDGKEIATLRGHRDKMQAIAISPVDGAIFSGGRDADIRVWDGMTGRFLRILGNTNSWVGALALTPDGKSLVSTCAGGGRSPCSSEPQIVWDIASGRRLQQPRHHDNIVMTAAANPDGRVIATGGGDRDVIHVWDLSTGDTRKVLSGTGASRWAVGFSSDGQRVGWGNTWRSHGNTSTHTSEASSPIEFHLRLAAVGQSLGEPERTTAGAAATFHRARTTHGDYALAFRAGGYGYVDAILDINKNGRTLVSIERAAHDGYTHNAYTFTPDGQTIVSGGANGTITAYDLNGRKLGNFVGHDGVIWAVTPSPDGRLLVSGSADQTVRLWNLKTRELIVTLFHGTDGEWVMWTPQGYYTGSPGADKIVGWQINKGPEHAADYVGAEQLREHLNRPDIVEKAVVLASAEEAVRQSPGTSFKLADLLSRPVPRFRIVSPLAGSAQNGGRAAVKLAIEATPDPVRLIRVQVNGRQVAEHTPAIDSGGFREGERTLTVPLAKGRNEIRVTLTNAIGDSKPESGMLTLLHDGDGDLDKLGTLHILAIGVTDYKGLGNVCGEDSKESCDLDYAGTDASKLADAVEKRLGPGHARVSKRVLVNGRKAEDAPTAANITDAVEQLRLAKESDTVVLFIAGHGRNDGPDYRFLATDASWLRGALRGSTVVPWQILQGAIEAAKGRRILFIDTCHSGNAYNQRLSNAAYHANIMAYTAARFDQEAIEDPALGHGLFTYAVVEGLEGKAMVPLSGEISTQSLADYVVGRVGAMAKALKGEQVPQHFKGRDAQDFVLARR
jgi:WD40 repeat protein